MSKVDNTESLRLLLDITARSQNDLQRRMFLILGAAFALLAACFAFQAGAAEAIQRTPLAGWLLALLYPVFLTGVAHAGAAAWIDLQGALRLLRLRQWMLLRALRLDGFLSPTGGVRQFMQAPHGWYFAALLWAAALANLVVALAPFLVRNPWIALWALTALLVSWAWLIFYARERREQVRASEKKLRLRLQKAPDLLHTEERELAALFQCNPRELDQLLMALDRLRRA